MWILGLALVVAGFCAALITAGRPRTNPHTGMSALGGAPASPSKNMAVAELGKAATDAAQPAGAAAAAGAAAGVAKEGKRAPTAATVPTAITASSSSMDLPPSLPPSLPLGAAMPAPALEAAAALEAHPPGALMNLPQLQARLAAAFAAERARGIAIGSRQPPESAARLQAAVRQEIQAYLASGCEDWREFVHWNDHHYVRNLVAENEDFELMVICWRYGQGSRVHNHADSHCWLTVLQGCVHELQYQMPPGGQAEEGTETAEAPALPGVLSAAAPCPRLRHLGIHELQAGETGYINDKIALHAVRVPEHCTGTGAVTMHLYAPPIRRVKLYEPDNNRVIQRKPGFYTVPPQYRKVHVPSREQTPREQLALEGAPGEQQEQGQAEAAAQANKVLAEVLEAQAKRVAPVQVEVPQAEKVPPQGQLLVSQGRQGKPRQQCGEQAGQQCEEEGGSQWSGWVI